MIQEQATALGRQIGQSDEYKAVKRTSEDLNGDRVAVAALRDMERLRQDAQAMLERGEQPTEEMERQLDDLLAQVQTNATYQRYVAAQDNFDKLMLRVNEWISEGIRKGASSGIITLG
jgi:cell fate (sporulation/competence/biofilm development) regulator YlbF (YheA/YmcA/DUF963 family)